MVAAEVESGGSIAGSRTAEIGALPSLRRDSLKVS
jgi:hypothetical protein